MPRALAAVPIYAPTRRVWRGLALATCALALGAPAAVAADEGGLAAGEAPAAASSSADSSTSSSGASARRAPVTRAHVSEKTIRAVQRKLGRRPDGVYGKRTRAAVRRFQRRRKLEVDGRLGPQTLAALKVGKREAPAPPAGAGQLLELIAECESGGDPAAVSSSGKHRGKYQFLTSTWRGLGGAGDPAEAPEGEQDDRAGTLLAAEGTKPWPTCGRQAAARIADDAS